MPFMAHVPWIFMDIQVVRRLLTDQEIDRTICGYYSPIAVSTSLLETPLFLNSQR